MPKRTHYLMVDEDDPQWLRFWAAYPKRVSKKDARKAFAELNPTPELVDKMIEALAWQSQQPQWTKDGGQYAPFPATWLHKEKWDDEPPAHLRPRERPACPHIELCGSLFRCDQLQKIDPDGRKWPLKSRGAA